MNQREGKKTEEYDKLSWTRTHQALLQITTLMSLIFKKHISPGFSFSQSVSQSILCRSLCPSGQESLVKITHSQSGAALHLYHPPHLLQRLHLSLPAVRDSSILGYLVANWAMRDTGLELITQLRAPYLILSTALLKAILIFLRRNHANKRLLQLLLL